MADGFSPEDLAKRVDEIAKQKLSAVNVRETYFAKPKPTKATKAKAAREPLAKLLNKLSDAVLSKMLQEHPAVVEKLAALLKSKAAA